MLARAFIDDPIAEWACRPDSLRRSMLERFYTTYTRQLLPHEEVWISAERTSAALWTPPERWRLSALKDAQLSRCLLHPRLIWRLPLIAVGLYGLERKHPVAPPQWYLATLGTDPDAQGQGLGSAVLEPVLDQCDRDGVAAYLESSKERNIDYYARHGFRVTGEFRLPRGPRVWPMWREPR
jgi:GNAT superfamily N-acetyltransferase